ncbi:MAG: hypothetical protein ACLT98_08770 [Eggerthellaceae bacterium]
MPDNATRASHPAASAVSGAQVFKKFIGYYSKYKFLFWFDLLCATLLACIDLAFPQLLNFFTRDFFLQPAPVVMGALAHLRRHDRPVSAAHGLPVVHRPLGSSWARAWRPICAPICSTNTNASAFRITTRTTPAK